MGNSESINNNIFIDVNKFKNQYRNVNKQINSYRFDRCDVYQNKEN